MPSHIEKVTFILKIIVQIGLLIFVICTFGIPSIERYNQQKTLVTTTEVFNENLDSPAITLCVQDKQSGTGFSGRARGGQLL